ncbi:thiamine-monophosphate kinase [Hydrogenobacter thermophilus TK-6]|uniref:Thiamine-monophosphate kinase n=1 Tax=Hydrogenobacter thermophilus (strain DSM 6534 / IAM 12695 / TK-6) TaxID=608538 RepID=D3DJP7_HYDTT|nr:thiamine-phosphate kinase [Hydrogenobacter thermophilus]ADO45972.1 thiamine-monophosphate kinase [Hydrogenobacter thermophilus TK-6]BAI70049.1 thiamine monophosphate kinase [Hydrogenobacter thermophilus TK-6]
MRISQVGEFGLIQILKGILSSPVIGDDTAPVHLNDKTLLLTTDSMLEDRHFKRFYPPQAVGWKAISVNVSDVVASGGNPLWVLISLALPDLEVSYVESLYEGIKTACDFYNCHVVGGNLTKSDRIMIDVFMIGKAERFVSRSGAKPGDKLYVSGTLGDSKAGLELLLMERRQYEEFELKLIERHTRPTARIDYTRHISKYANACIDISDGLSSDVWHISRMSNVKININSKDIPISQELRLFCNKHGKDPLDYALSGGEDYQLLFTHPEDRYNPFLDMRSIGSVEEGYGVYLDGRELSPSGFDHFKLA